MYASSSYLQATTNNIIKSSLPNYKEVQATETIPKTNLISNNLKNIRDVTPNLVSEMVNLIQIRHSYTANAKAVQTSEELVGSFLDSMA